ncbi:MAG TPA: sulfite exporter TauE/SafE family protein [Negativicutes bacterium]
MKIKVTFIFLVCFLINCSVFAAPFWQLEVKQSIENNSGQIGGALQHNALTLNLTRLQRNLNENIATEIKELKEQKNEAFLFSILLISFLYGIFHAIGPGHGKTVISSWIIAQQRSLSEVLFISVFAAVFHALSAALLVSGTYIILGKFAAVSTQKLNIDLQIAAAILLIGIGLGMLIRVAKRKCPKISSNAEQKTAGRWGKLVVALSIGIVPCPVTSVILIFCLTLGLIWQGVLLVIAFAMGMGTSLVVISLLVWYLKEKMTNKKLTGFQYIVTAVLPVMGGIFLVLMGSVILNSLY